MESRLKVKNRTVQTGSLRRIRVGDIVMAYREYGSGEPLVLITAYSINKAFWDSRFLKRLASRYRVIVFDNRGMGRTTTGTAPWSIDRFAADTAGLIEALGLDRAHVLGWSLGGDVALSLAVNFPERVEKLIIYAGDCGGPHKYNAPRYRDVLKKAFSGPWVPFVGVLANLFPPEWMRANPGYWRSVPFFKLRVRPWNIVRQNRAYNEWQGVYEQLPDIQSPALIITGTEDVSTPAENAHILADRIPESRLVLAPGAGHGLMYQHPHEFAKSVTEFLSGYSRGTVKLLLPEQSAGRRAGSAPTYRVVPEDAGI